MTKITYRLGEVMTLYWCHKSEALKAIVKKPMTYFHSGPGFSDTQYMWHAIYNHDKRYHRFFNITG